MAGTKLPAFIKGILKVATSIQVDTISELTTDNGVSVDGCLIKDGAVADINIGNLSAQTSLISGDIFVIERSGTRYKIDSNNMNFGGGTAVSNFVNFTTDDLTAGVLTISGYQAVCGIIDDDGKYSRFPMDSLTWSGGNTSIDLSSFTLNGVGRVAIIPNTISTSFENSDLVSGKLTINYPVSVIGIVNNSGEWIIPDNVKRTTTTEIDLTTYGTLTGTWYVVLCATAIQEVTITDEYQTMNIPGEAIFIALEDSSGYNSWEISDVEYNNNQTVLTFGVTNGNYNVLLVGGSEVDDRTKRYDAGSQSGSVSLDYRQGDYQQLTTVTSTPIIDITMTNSSDGDWMVIEIDNTNATTVTVNSTLIIEATDTDTYLISIGNVGGSIIFANGKTEIV